VRLNPIWRPFKGCPKCDGEGWLWSHELSEYHGEATGCPDDTRYACDHHSHEDYSDPADRWEGWPDPPPRS
jgi:hypothetical protein